jgi:microcystin-dependent protein
VSTPYLGQISIFSFGFAPKGWALANGQILPITQNTALFALLGTTYGGDGERTFQLPNFQARVPIHMGNGFSEGQVGGESIHTLINAEMPAHSHTVSANKNAGTQASPASNLWAADGDGNLPYSSAGGQALAPGAIGTAGGGQPHNNMAPYLVLNFCIALQGIFPSRN